MVSLTRLAQISNLSDVIGTLVVIKHPSGRFVYKPWYHDRNYGSDEYGCTSLPNIFHHWLLKLEDVEAGNLANHINLLGTECTDLVHITSSYVPQKKALLIAGYTYVGANTGYPRVVIVDLSDPLNPRVIKDLRHSRSGSPARTAVVYSAKHDKMLIGVLGPETAVYYGTWDEVLNASNIDSLTKLADGYWGMLPIDNDRVMIGGPSGRAVVDLSTMTVQTPSDNPNIDNLGNLVHRTYDKLVTIVVDTTYKIRFLDLDLNVVSEFDTGLPKPDNLEKLWIATDGINVVVIDNHNMKILLVDPTNGIKATTDISEVCAWGDLVDKGYILCTDFIEGTGKFVKLVLDGYYSVSRQNNKVCLSDEAGNPVTNKTVYVCRSEISSPALDSAYQELPGFERTCTQVTTDSNGCIDLSGLEPGVYVILAPR